MCILIRFVRWKQSFQFLIISANKVMFYMAFVCLSVCLFVCLFATSRKTLIGFWWKFYQRCDVSVDKEEMIKFWKLSSRGSGSRIFEGIFNIARLYAEGIFPQFGSYSGRSGSSWNFSQMYPWTERSPLKLEIIWIRTLDPDFGYRLWIRTKFALAEVCSLRVLSLS